MQGPIDPSRLSFGAPAAERDVHLEKYFFESDSFKSLRSGKKTLILGNRGTGKTAILKSLARQARGTHMVLELAPDDYSYGMLQSTLRKEEQGAWAKQASYAAGWKYVIYISAMKAVTRSGTSLKYGAAAKIYNYLRDNHANVDTNPIGSLISFIKRLEGVKIGSFEAGIKARELEKLYRLEELQRPLDYLSAFTKTKPVLILVDELDRGWDDSEDARAFVAGLFNAATAINQESKGVKVILSLRLELYRSIPSLFDDAQKYRDIIEFLVWDEESLLEMIAKRLRVSLPEIDFLQPEHIWNRIFGDSLGQRQTRSFKYIIDRTLYRPRELIQFCDLVREVALKKGAPPPFDYNIVGEAEIVHSESRLKDIAAEFRFEFCGLEDLFETFRGMPCSYDREALEYHCLRISEGELDVGRATEWCGGMDPGKLIETLWWVGFLRAQSVGGFKQPNRPGSAYLGPHQVHSLSVLNSKRFDVHPMFRTYLGMKQGSYRP